MKDSDKITVIFTREEIERLVVILNGIFRRDIDVEHFLEILEKARKAGPAAVS